MLSQYIKKLEDSESVHPTINKCNKVVYIVDVISELKTILEWSDKNKK